MSDSTMQVKRPGALTLVVIYLWVVAVAAVLVGAIVLIGSWSDEVIAETGRTATELRIMGIFELALGLVIVFAAVALSSGARGARTLVAVVAVLRIAVTVFLVAFAHTQAYLLAGLLHVLLPAFILWVLYGNDKVEAYFDRSV